MNKFCFHSKEEESIFEHLYLLSRRYECEKTQEASIGFCWRERMGVGGWEGDLGESSFLRKQEVKGRRQGLGYHGFAVTRNTELGWEEVL